MTSEAATRPSVKSVFRIGILSTARIARDFAFACKSVQNVSIVAVASRTPEKAQEFASTYNIPHACTYDELLSIDLDSVYIPVPTTLATSWACRFLEAGRHVLVDKPFVSACDVSQLIERARSANVALMDGTHFVHARRTTDVREAIASNVGNIRRIVATFCCPLGLDAECGDIRVNKSLEPMGALGDLGWYCARAAVTFLGPHASVVEDVEAVGGWMKGTDGVWERASGVVRFEGGHELLFECDFGAVLRQRVEIIGDKGVLRINDFVRPLNQAFENKKLYGGIEGSLDTEYEIERKLSRADEIILPSIMERIHVHEEKLQSSRMVEEFARISTESTGGRELWMMETLHTQKILDAIYTRFMKKYVQREHDN